MTDEPQSRRGCLHAWQAAVTLNISGDHLDLFWSKLNDHENDRVLIRRTKAEVFDLYCRTCRLRYDPSIYETDCIEVGAEMEAKLKKERVAAHNAMKREDLKAKRKQGTP